jgi:coproporphyrinogen III oxidase
MSEVGILSSASLTGVWGRILLTPLVGNDEDVIPFTRFIRELFAEKKVHGYYEFESEWSEEYAEE